MNKAGILFFLTCASASNVAAQSYTETFTGGTNQGAWTWGNTNDVIEATGGNPGAYLHNPNTDTFAPQPQTGDNVQSSFTGDYRARRVVSLDIDLITHSTQFNFARPLSLILENDSGTPADPTDDCTVYVVTDQFVPQVIEGWKSFTVAVPAQSATLPAGWATPGNCAGTVDAIWNTVITDVDRVRWFYGDPANFFIFDLWDVGMDNARIVEEVGTGTCFGDGSNGPCPCGNLAGANEGCANSSGMGAKLSAVGSTSIAADDLTLLATQMRPNALSIAFQGNAVVSVPLPFGDGLRCAAGTLTRFPVTQADNTGSATFGPGLGAIGNWSVGPIYGFQVYHRDAGGPCGTNFNVTYTLAVQFTN